MEKGTLIAIILAVFIVGVAGGFLVTYFTDIGRLIGAVTGVHIEESPDLRMSDFECKSGWNLGIGCYYVCSGTVYNSGAAASNVRLQIQFEEENGTIGPTKTIIIGDLGAGDYKKFSTEPFDVSCFKKYGYRYRFLYGAYGG